eukprot:Clim_evm30s134 gene=Clim_evmTU30s134
MKKRNFGSFDSSGGGTPNLKNSNIGSDQTPQLQRAFMPAEEYKWHEDLMKAFDDGLQNDSGAICATKRESLILSVPVAKLKFVDQNQGNTIWKFRNIVGCLDDKNLVFVRLARDKNTKGSIRRSMQLRKNKDSGPTQATGLEIPLNEISLNISQVEKSAVEITLASNEISSEGTSRGMLFVIFKNQEQANEWFESVEGVRSWLDNGLGGGVDAHELGQQQHYTGLGTVAQVPSDLDLTLGTIEAEDSVEFNDDTNACGSVDLHERDEDICDNGNSRPLYSAEQYAMGNCGSRCSVFGQEDSDWEDEEDQERLSQYDDTEIESNSSVALDETPKKGRGLTSVLRHTHHGYTDSNSSVADAVVSPCSSLRGNVYCLSRSGSSRRASRTLHRRSTPPDLLVRPMRSLALGDSDSQQQAGAGGAELLHSLGSYPAHRGPSSVKYKRTSATLSVSSDSSQSISIKGMRRSSSMSMNGKDNCKVDTFSETNEDGEEVAVYQDTDGNIQLMAASRDALIDRLISADGSKDSIFVDMILHTHSVVMTSLELLQELITRFATKKRSTTAEHRQVQQAIIMVIIRWVDIAPDVFGDEDGPERAFLDQFMARTGETGFALAERLLQETLEGSVSEHRKAMQEASARRSRLAMGDRETDDLGWSSEVIGNVDARYIAEQVTIYNWSLLKRITMTDAMGFYMNGAKGKTGNEASTFKDFIARYDEESYWVATAICCARTVREQSALIAKFIQIAKHCYILNNIFSVFTIVQCLDGMPVKNLIEAWGGVSQVYMNTIQHLRTTLVHHGRNMKAYREKVENIGLQPWVPFLPTHMKDIVFIKDGNPTHVNGLINVEKLRKLHKTINVLLSGGQVSYPAKEDQAARNFLENSLIVTDIHELKARSQEAL